MFEKWSVLLMDATCANCGVLLIDGENKARVIHANGSPWRSCLDMICLESELKRYMRWEQYQSELGLAGKEARQARRDGKMGKQKQEDQLKRDAGWKFTWVSPEEWKVIQIMRGDA